MQSDTGSIGQVSQRIDSENFARHSRRDFVNGLLSLSALQLKQDGLVEWILGLLDRFSLDPEMLDLEITETAALENLPLAITQLNKLREAGGREAGGYFDPFRSEHYSDPQIIETYSPAFLAAHCDSMTRSIPDLYLRGQSEYFDALRE